MHSVHVHRLTLVSFLVARNDWCYNDRFGIPRILLAPSAVHATLLITMIATIIISRSVCIVIGVFKARIHWCVVKSSEMRTSSNWLSNHNLIILVPDQNLGIWWRRRRFNRFAGVYKRQFPDWHSINRCSATDRGAIGMSRSARSVWMSL